jgi:phenylalanyl-tRNA synthetase beta subunit
MYVSFIMVTCALCTPSTKNSMQISYATLQDYFAAPLPPLEAVADAFTFHTFEIDGVEGDVLDVKVLPNRASDCKTEVGLARQLSAILDLPLKPEYEQVALGTTQVRTTLAQINGTLGLALSAEEVESVFRRLRLGVAREDEQYVITAPADRADLIIPVDIAEEVGQILGYDVVPEMELSALETPADQARYRGIQRMKDQLVEQGFAEVSTQSFAKTGDVELANPLDKSKPFLRTSLEENLTDALTRAKQYAQLLYGTGEKSKLFEVGAVFPKSGEYLELRMTETAWEGVPTYDNLSVAKLEDYGKDYVPVKHTLGMYKPFSLYPFITRDIAFWAPAGTEATEIENIIRENAGELLARLDQFDRFKKEGRVSYGFRMVFQSMDRTLTDEGVSGVMTKISSALTAKGYEIR